MHYEVDYILRKGRCSLQEANKFEEQSRITLDWLKDLKRLSPPLMIFSRVAMCLLIAAILLEQGWSGQVNFSLIYSIAGVLIVIHIAWLTIFESNTEASFRARNDVLSSKLPPLPNDEKMNKFENLKETQNEKPVTSASHLRQRNAHKVKKSDEKILPIVK